MRVRKMITLFLVCGLLLGGCGDANVNTVDNKINEGRDKNALLDDKEAELNENEEEEGYFEKIGHVLEEVMSNISIDKTEEDSDSHSIWIKGKEYKILEYIDEDYMLVKFALSNKMIQAVLPRGLEEKQYNCEYHNEDWDSTYETAVKFVNKDKDYAVYVGYAKGDAIEEEYLRMQEEFNNDENNEEIEIMTTTAGDKVFASKCQEEVVYGEWDKNGVLMDGYIMSWYDKTENIAILYAVLSADEEKREKGKRNAMHLAYRNAEDSDYLYRSESTIENYDEQIDAMYEKYMEILKDPNTYLIEKCEALGEEYSYHSIADMNGDGIPELIFFGRPRSIVIVGQNNSIHIWGEEILLTEEPNKFWVGITFTGETTWQKSEIITEQGGNIAINMLDEEYLEYDEFNGCNYKGNEISETEYYEILDKMRDVKIPNLSIQELWEMRFTKKGFYRSNQILTNERIY